MPTVLPVLNIPPRKQDAVYWGSPVPDGEGGYTFASPIEIKCRWDDVAEVFRNAATGEEETSKSKVYPDRVLEVNGYLKEGTLDDSTMPSNYADPMDIEGAFQIRSFERIPNYGQTKVLLVAVL